MFNRYNICMAYYVYALEWHGGQFTRAYKIFGRLKKIKFHPMNSRLSYENLTEEEKIIYEGLVNSKY